MGGKCRMARRVRDVQTMMELELAANPVHVDRSTLWVAATDMNGAGRVFNYGPAYPSSSAGVLRTLLAAGADPHLTTDDGTTPLMAAAGRGRATYTPRVPRGTRSALLAALGADTKISRSGTAWQ